MKKALLILVASLLFIGVVVFILASLGFTMFKYKTVENSKELATNKETETEIKINDIDKIINHEWKWVKTMMNNDEVITPKNKDVFSISFKENNVLSGTTDCNGFFGKYLVADNNLTLNMLGATKKYCQNSQEAGFMKSLNEVESCFINENNQLVFQLKYDTGSMIFE